MGLRIVNYDDRLKFLSLTKLDKRKIINDLVESFTILNGFYNTNRDLFFKLDDGGRRGHKKKHYYSKENFVWILKNFFYRTSTTLRSLYATTIPSVCLSSVTLVRSTQPVEIFANFFHHTIAQGL